MNRSVRVLVGLVVLLTLLSAAGCTKLRARDQLNKGVQSYKNARYEEAINHFKQAVELDPTLINARVYLATAYAQQYVPGADTEDNLRMANSAIEEYKKVIEADPKNINSVKGIAYLYLQMKKFDDAKTWYRKASEIDRKIKGCICCAESHHTRIPDQFHFTPAMPPDIDTSFLEMLY